MTIELNDFVKRQCEGSPYSYYLGSWEELLDLVRKHFRNTPINEGQRVVKVKVPAKGFMTSIITIDETTDLVATFEARREGELEHKVVRARYGKLTPATHVEIILYSHAALVEDDENSTDADWEIISLNASPVNGATPISVGALLRNYYGEVGGTDHGLTPEQFIEELRISREFWRDKCQVLKPAE